jgi:hypothetical protein
VRSRPLDARCYPTALWQIPPGNSQTRSVFIYVALWEGTYSSYRTLFHLALWESTLATRNLLRPGLPKIVGENMVEVRLYLMDLASIVNNPGVLIPNLMLLLTETSTRVIDLFQTLYPILASYNTLWFGNVVQRTLQHSIVSFLLYIHSVPCLNYDFVWNCDLAVWHQTWTYETTHICHFLGNQFHLLWTWLESGSLYIFPNALDATQMSGVLSAWKYPNRQNKNALIFLKM